jgi:uncharacterized membrane protein YdjX (TVP38/TMEM64 family)
MADPRPCFAPWARIALVVLVVVALGTTLHLTGLDVYLSRERLRHLMASLGALGLVAYLGVFVATELVQGPTPLLVIAAVAVYGPVWGALVGYVAMVLSTNVFFLFARALGGRALGDVQNPRVQRVLAAVDRHPLRTVLLLRGVLWLLPAVGYALSLSRLRFRDHLLGSVLSLWSPCIQCALFGEAFLRLLS